MLDESVDPLLGSELDGRYRLEGRLGEGGLGVVYRAVHLRLQRSFAIKVLQPEYAENQQLRARFEREAQALGALTHPGVVGVTDFGIDGQRPFLVMELLEGATLDQRVPLPDGRVLSIVRDVLGAVAFAHGLGLVHRDLKPSNVFLQSLPEGEERVRVLDFGLAKFLDGSDGGGLTRPGATLGTPAYMSPEQALGGAASPRNDVYSLGLLLYELLVHERPFAGEGGELMRQHLLVPIPSLAGKRPDLPALTALDAIVQRACAKSPVERFADAGEMRNALDLALGRTSGAYSASSVSRSGEIAALAPALAPGASAASMASATQRAQPVDESARTVLAAPSGAAETVGAVGQLGAVRAVVVRPAPSVAAQTERDAPEGGATAGTGRTVDERPPAPRMPATRPSMQSPTSTSGGHAGGNAGGLALMLALVLAIALGAVAVFLPNVFGLSRSPLDWIRAQMGGEGPESEGPESEGPESEGPEPSGASDVIVRESPPEAAPEAPDAPVVVASMFHDRDPWLESVSPQLERYRARFARGDRYSASRAGLRGVGREDASDPRPVLLMAHWEFSEGARSDAMDHYQRAMEIDPVARLDPAMRDNLVIMSAHRTVGERARQLVVQYYGVDALEALRRIRITLDDSEEIERLDAFEEVLLGP